MARFKNVDYDQMEMIPLCFQDQILEGSFEYTLDYLVESQLDLGCFTGNYHNDRTGSKAIHPAILLKIILYAYSKGIISSRKIEGACRTNIVFKALSANTVPDHSTIAAFVSGMKDQIQPIFQYVLMVCSSEGLIGGDMFAVDGCKLPSNASKEWSGTFKDLGKKKDKFEKLAGLLLEKHREADKKGDSDAAGAIRKRVEKMKRKANKIGEFLKNEKPKPGKRRNENQSNITDNESAKIKSSKGVIQGYNGLAMVDSKRQVIAMAEVFGAGQEGEFLETVVDGADKNMKRITGIGLKDKVLLADTNYFSEDNLRKMSKRGIDAVIPDQQFRKRDVRFEERDRHRPAKKNYFKREEDFVYDQKSDTYLCPKGYALKYSGIDRIGNMTVRRYISRRSECHSCPFMKRCIRSENSKYRTLLKPVKVDNRNYSEAMRKRIDTQEGRDLYSKRMGIVEPVFANIVSCKGMNRFTLRGKAKVNIQWLLFSIVHNIGKIWVYGK